MKTRERPGKTLRRVVPVFVSQVNDSAFLVSTAFVRVPFSVAGNFPPQYFQSGQVQPAVPQVLPDGIAGHYFKAFLEIERREMYGISHFFRTDILEQMFFHIIDCLLQTHQPVHSSSSDIQIRMLFFLKDSYMVPYPSSKIMSFSVLHCPGRKDEKLQIPAKWFCCSDGCFVVS